MSMADVYPVTVKSVALAAGRSNESNVPGPPPGMPASISRTQLYYWSAKWQADEAETLAELKSGDTRQFESASDAIRWLLSDD